VTGAFTVTEVLPGPYTVTFVSACLRAAPQSIVVVEAFAAGNHVLRITHPGFETTFRSVVLDVGAAGVPFVTFTNAEGRFELQVTDDSSTLLATYPGSQRNGPRRSVVVNEGQPVTLDAIEPGTCDPTVTLAGFALHSGSGSHGFRRVGVIKSWRGESMPKQFRRLVRACGLSCLNQRTFVSTGTGAALSPA